MVRFIPKLQRQFAEFLLHGSPERLRIFISTTCVGLRYGLLLPNLRGFSRQLLGSLTLAEASVYFRILPSRTDLPVQPIATYLIALFRKCEELSILRRPIETNAGAGILTSFPSATPFGFT